MSLSFRVEERRIAVIELQKADEYKYPYNHFINDPIICDMLTMRLPLPRIYVVNGKVLSGYSIYSSVMNLLNSDKFRLMQRSLQRRIEEQYLDIVIFRGEVPDEIVKFLVNTGI